MKHLIKAIDEYIGFLEYKLESTELVLQTKEQELSQLRKENETLHVFSRRKDLGLLLKFYHYLHFSSQPDNPFLHIPAASLTSSYRLHKKFC